MDSPRGEQADLRSLIHALWRRKWLFLAFVVVVPAAVYAISTQVPKTYQATAVLSLETTSVDSSLVPGQPTFGAASGVDLVVNLINTDKVVNEAARELGKPVGSGGGSVEATPILGSAGATTGLLSIVATADSARGAAALATAYARAVDTLRTREAIKQVDQSIAQLEAESDATNSAAAKLELGRQLRQLRAVRVTQQDATEIIQEANPPASAISPRPRRNTALAAVVGVLLGLAAVALAERLDRRLRDATDLEPLLAAPLLSVIPKGAFPGERPARSPVAEAFRTLAASLLYFNVDRRLETVMVASPTKGDGKTTVATHLAIALARDGQRVILVDCDLRRPQVAVRLGIEPSAGVAMVLTDQVQLGDALAEVDVGDGQLQVLAGGEPPPNPARLLSSARLDSLLTELSKQADIVIVDTPPLLGVSDAVPLLERVSGSVVVARLDYTERNALERLRQVIETAHGTILGAVATGADAAGLYGYGSDYYDESSTKVAAEPTVNGAGEAQPEARPRQTAPKKPGAST